MMMDVPASERMWSIVMPNNPPVPSRPSRTRKPGRPASPRRPATGRRAAAQARHRYHRHLAIGAIIAVIAIALGGVLFFVFGGTSSGPTPVVAPTADAAVVNTVASLTPAQLQTAVNEVSASDLNLPAVIKGAPELVAGGKPEIVSIGAEYCPFCAADRWALVAALSQFGTWSNLNLTTSSSTDLYPSTVTFTFHGAVYTSKYLSFTGLELSTNTHVALDTPTAAQQNLLKVYDAPPYQKQAGSIPFVDFAGKSLTVGAPFDPGVLKGLSALQIATATQTPSSPAGKAIDATAGYLTRQLCQLTGGQPLNVCGAIG